MILDLISHPLFGTATTVGAYAVAQALHRRYPHFHPFFVTTAILLALILPASWLLPLPHGL